MQVFGPMASGVGLQRTGKKDDRESGGRRRSQEVYIALPLLPAPRFPSSSEGLLLHFAACFSYFLLEGFFTFMCLESVHKKDVHITDPCAEFFPFVHPWIFLSLQRKAG